MYFRDIPGKEAEKTFLRESVKKGRVAHAQMFAGRRGSGQLAMALAYASYLMCTDKMDDDSCGKCPACIKSHQYVHPDLHFTFPVVKKDGKDRKDTTSDDFLPEWRDALKDNPYMDINGWLSRLDNENAQPNINVRECDHIFQKLGLGSFESEYKVLIIWLPEYLRKEGNRLLKIIEEPTDKTVIILVTEHTEEILGTILSRVQLLKVSTFSDVEVRGELEKRFGTSASALESLVGLADGDMAKAYTLAVDDDNDFSERLLRWLRTSYKMEPVEMGAQVNEMASWGRETQKHFFEYCLHFLREYIFWRMTGVDSKRLTKKEQESVKKMSSLLNLSKTESLIGVMDDCILMIGRNASPKILFMTESLRIGRIMRGVGEMTSIFDV